MLAFAASTCASGRARSTSHSENAATSCDPETYSSRSANSPNNNSRSFAMISPPFVVRHGPRSLRRTEPPLDRFRPEPRSSAPPHPSGRSRQKETLDSHGNSTSSRRTHCVSSDSASPSVLGCVSRDQRCARPAPRAPGNPVPAPARIFRVRVSHISMFQNVGSAREMPPKTPRKPMSGCALVSRLFPTFSSGWPLDVVFPVSIFAPQIGSETKTDASRTRIAATAQQTPVG
jgi:hypothetical protein